MERTMSVEDKIRRAEEIYNRRREQEYKTKNAKLSVENSKEENKNINKKLVKMIMQIIVCMLIYLSIYYLTKTEYIFSENIKNKCEEILSYDISFTEMYKKIADYILIMQQKYKEVNNIPIEESKEENVEQEENIEQSEEIKDEEIQEDQISGEQGIEAQNSNVEETKNENIGGAVENASEEHHEETKSLSEEEQMKQDAEEIKAKISFIKPLTGVVTSTFGWRNPTTKTVPKNHTGIDIAANEGTDIISATNGKVILASSEGSYGNHLKIEIDDVIIIYAHCLKLLVKEGETIKQGQTIAKVGSTGNSTGPHLHFEIRKNDMHIDPSLILDF